ncbi:hypothetical protein C7446_2077 [Kushneria sinocarnis]|uniref:Uncharacterized protein n=1 Tax=Kushneria sinocarnis TaxID=595502 RepID=A0A420WWR5_9GAMM|nr:hypothetical protein [Kushneria sinocarnis]RKR03551.1 hypothetical protein C7446_2077 [Kushneria sinocarnis]
MTRFTLTIGEQSIDFTEADMAAMDSALTGATNMPGREIVRGGSERFVSVIRHREGDESRPSHMTHRATIQRLTDLRRGPDTETDC